MKFSVKNNLRKHGLTVKADRHLTRTTFSGKVDFSFQDILQYLPTFVTLFKCNEDDEDNDEKIVQNSWSFLFVLRYSEDGPITKLYAKTRVDYVVISIPKITCYPDENNMQSEKCTSENSWNSSSKRFFH